MVASTEECLCWCWTLFHHMWQIDNFCLLLLVIMRCRSDADLSWRGAPIDGNPNLPPNCASGSAFAAPGSEVKSTRLKQSWLQQLQAAGGLKAKIESKLMKRTHLRWGELVWWQCQWLQWHTCWQRWKWGTGTSSFDRRLPSVNALKRSYAFPLIPPLHVCPNQILLLRASP